jgi:hypothetical protein
MTSRLYCPTHCTVKPGIPKYGAPAENSPVFSELMVGVIDNQKNWAGLTTLHLALKLQQLEEGAPFGFNGVLYLWVVEPIEYQM